MSKENNKIAIELCKSFYRAIDKKVTPALMRQGIGQFKNLLSVYTEEELSKVIQYIADGNVPNVYSPGYLSYATNKLLDEIKLKVIKSNNTVSVKALDEKIENNVKRQSSFLDKFM